MVRPKLEYTAEVWPPQMLKNIRKIERIQRMATKMVPEIKALPFQDRLKERKLSTLKDRERERERGN